jgi:hypothetical protein
LAAAGLRPDWPTVSLAAAGLRPDWPTVSLAAADLRSDWPTVSLAAADLRSDWPTVSWRPPTFGRTGRRWRRLEIRVPPQACAFLRPGVFEAECGEALVEIMGGLRTAIRVLFQAAHDHGLESRVRCTPDAFGRRDGLLMRMHHEQVVARGHVEHVFAVSS